MINLFFFQPKISCSLLTIIFFIHSTTNLFAENNFSLSPIEHLNKDDFLGSWYVTAYVDEGHSIAPKKDSCNPPLKIEHKAIEGSAFITTQFFCNQTAYKSPTKLEPIVFANYSRFSIKAPFSFLFHPEYHVLYFDHLSSIMVLGGNSNKKLFILSRTLTPTEADFQKLITSLNQKCSLTKNPSSCTAFIAKLKHH